MEIKEIRQKNTQELHETIQYDREQLRQLRFDLASGKVKNVRAIRVVRRKIARVLTILKEKNKK